MKSILTVLTLVFAMFSTQSFSKDKVLECLKPDYTTIYIKNVIDENDKYKEYLLVGDKQYFYYGTNMSDEKLYRNDDKGMYIFRVIQYNDTKSIIIYDSFGEDSKALECKEYSTES